MRKLLFSLNELIILEKHTKRLVNLTFDESDSRLFTVPEIFEIRSIHKKISEKLRSQIKSRKLRINKMVTTQMEGTNGN